MEATSGPGISGGHGTPVVGLPQVILTTLWEGGTTSGDLHHKPVSQRAFAELVSSCGAPLLSRRNPVPLRLKGRKATRERGKKDVHGTAENGSSRFRVRDPALPRFRSCYHRTGPISRVMVEALKGFKKKCDGEPPPPPLLSYPCTFLVPPETPSSFFCRRNPKFLPFPSRAVTFAQGLSRTPPHTLSTPLPSFAFDLTPNLTPRLSGFPLPTTPPPSTPLNLVPPPPFTIAPSLSPPISFREHFKRRSISPTLNLQGECPTKRDFRTRANSRWSGPFGRMTFLRGQGFPGVGCRAGSEPRGPEAFGNPIFLEVSRVLPVTLWGGGSTSGRRLAGTYPPPLGDPHDRGGGQLAYTRPSPPFWSPLLAGINFVPRGPGGLDATKGKERKSVHRVGGKGSHGIRLRGPEISLPRSGFYRPGPDTRNPTGAFRGLQSGLPAKPLPFDSSAFHTLVSLPLHPQLPLFAGKKKLLPSPSRPPTFAQGPSRTPAHTLPNPLPPSLSPRLPRLHPERMYKRAQGRSPPSPVRRASRGESKPGEVSGPKRRSGDPPPPAW